jgi:Fur family iron response transcriptional regulator
MELELAREDALEDRLKSLGLRPTKQRMGLGKVIWSKGFCHVTPEDVHLESQKLELGVSLATVYNTLHQFKSAGLLKEITAGCGRSYFDTNLSPHQHFFIEQTGQIIDVDECFVNLAIPQLPEGATISSIDVVIRLSLS